MSNLSQEEEHRLLEAIHPILLERGLKSTTMDLVAKRLQISKRTLYEIFVDKADMINRVLDYHTELHKREAQRIMAESPNVMMAVIRILAMHRDELSRVNANYFRDLDRLCPEMRQCHRERHEEFNRICQHVYGLGVEQGYFRPDVNFMILIKMLEIQSESLKRMEECFPPEFTLLEIYDTIILGFIRSISSFKGLQLLEESLAEHFSNPASTQTSSNESSTIFHL